MKKLLLFVIMITATVILPISLIAQASHEDVIYLKSGTVVRGTIIELIPNQSVKIQTKDNLTFGFSFDVIDKIIKESGTENTPKESTQKPSNAPQNPDSSKSNNPDNKPTSFGQAFYEDVVYLKNGSIIHGIIIEQIPNQSIKIKTADKNVFVFKIEEIEKISKEEITPPPRENTAIQVIPSSQSESAKSNQHTKNFFWGINASLGISSLFPDDNLYCQELASGMNQESGYSGFSFSSKPRIGFSGGFIFESRLYHSLFFQTDLEFNMKGAVAKGNGYYKGSPVSIVATIRLNYINVPIYAKYYFFSKGSPSQNPSIFNLFLLAGPDLNFAVSREDKLVVKANGDSDTQTQSDNDYQQIDLTIDVGGGFEFFKFLDLNFRYSFGVLNILKNPSDYNNMKLKNSTYSIGLGVNF